MAKQWRVPEKIKWLKTTMKNGKSKLPKEILTIDEKEEKKNGNKILKPKNCSRCEYISPSTSKFCQRCGIALDLKTAMELKEERRKVDKVMNLLVKDPKVLQLLQRKIKELGVDNE